MRAASTMLPVDRTNGVASREENELTCSDADD
jgi:hypothetical protein